MRVGDAEDLLHTPLLAGEVARRGEPAVDGNEKRHRGDDAREALNDDGLRGRALATAGVVGHLVVEVELARRTGRRVDEEQRRPCGGAREAHHHRGDGRRRALLDASPIRARLRVRLHGGFVQLSEEDREAAADPGE